MTVALYVTFFGMLILTSLAIGSTIYHRRKVTCMTGMMIAMSLGMMVGLTAGVILGILFTGNLFYSTVLGILIGVIVGFVSGLPVSLMAVLDGALSGMMGGMMGAMLGEMIVPEYQDSLIRIMFVLFIALILVLFVMMKEEFMKKRKSILGHPAIILGLFVVFIIGYNQLDPLLTSSKSPNQMNHSPSNMNMVMNNNNLVVQADEFSFTPSKMEIPVGESVTMVLVNNGEIEHDLEIVGMETGTVESLSRHHHQQEENQIHVHSIPGEKQEVSFTPLEPGVYKYTCTIPGHAESGMTGTIKITS
ncbi:hypothetical protein CFK37_03480 [Virgibacillus phasianinus]|uniref:Blue (type 1) copper domain-containing protein n=1 Tax=Virgibacillus phasianinus TaxID=2017483 RepID=A0A220TZ64_9BACI|nr:plastocyanin/azurin family copper-binding protein [Virgibacillus phasianinus]ASK61304.1 hypothetical protein CFK37_03480 [Virgibacillus phasianinus]